MRTIVRRSGATPAWVEALLPDLGWVGFDPTNDLVASERHVRVAIGRDYFDVPPTRGVYQGASAVRSELAVAVTVGPAVPSGSETLPFCPVDDTTRRRGNAVHRPGRITTAIPDGLQASGAGRVKHAPSDTRPPRGRGNALQQSPRR